MTKLLVRLDLASVRSVDNRRPGMRRWSDRVSNEGLFLLTKPADVIFEQPDQSVATPHYHTITTSSISKLLLFTTLSGKSCL